MRVILTQNVIVDGGARRPGYVVSSWDVDFCEQLVERGLAVHESEPLVASNAVAAAPTPAQAVVEMSAPVVTAQPDPVAHDDPSVEAKAEAPHAEHPHETKAQRKAREKAERDAKARETAGEE